MQFESCTPHAPISVLTTQVLVKMAARCHGYMPDPYGTMARGVMPLVPCAETTDLEFHRCEYCHTPGLILCPRCHMACHACHIQCQACGADVFVDPMQVFAFVDCLPEDATEAELYQLAPHYCLECLADFVEEP